MFDPSSYLAVWAAVLEVSVNDVRDGAHGIECRASRAWLSSNNTQERSFLWVCDILDADPRRIRKMCHIDNSVNLSDTQRT